MPLVLAVSTALGCNEVRVGPAEVGANAGTGDVADSRGQPDASSADAIILVEGSSIQVPPFSVIASGLCLCREGTREPSISCLEAAYDEGVLDLIVGCVYRGQFMLTRAQLDYLDCANDVLAVDSETRMTSWCGTENHPTYTEPAQCEACVQADIDTIVRTCGDARDLGLAEAFEPCHDLRQFGP